MRKNVKRTIAVLSAVCMLPCPQVANVAVMAQNVSVGNSIGAKTLKQSLQTSTNFETASGKRQEVKENNIEDSYDITYGDSITFFVSKTKIPDQDQTDNSGNEDDQKQDDGQKDSETDVIPDYEVPDTINGFSFNKEETDDGYQLTFTANEAMRSAAIKIKGQDVVLKTKKRKLTAKASVKNKVYDGTTDIKEEQNLSVQLYSDSGTPDSRDVRADQVNWAYQSADVGEHNIEAANITLAGDNAKNYELTENSTSIKGNIVARDFASMTVSADPLTYNGTEQKPQIHASVEIGLSNESPDAVVFTYSKNGVDYQSEIPGFTDAGTYQVYVKASMANFNDAVKTVNVTVQQAPSSSGSHSGGGGKGSSGKSSSGKSSSGSSGTVTKDSQKGYRSEEQGVITGASNQAVNDGYSHWIKDARGWWLRYSDGTWPMGNTGAFHWEKVNGRWWAFGAEGYLSTGWIYDTLHQGWFYMDENQGMLTGWQFINGKWYYLNSNQDGSAGIMYSKRRTPDGWYVKEDGSWDEEAGR